MCPALVNLHSVLLYNFFLCECCRDSLRLLVLGTPQPCARQTWTYKNELNYKRYFNDHLCCLLPLDTKLLSRCYLQPSCYVWARQSFLCSSNILLPTGVKEATGTEPAPERPVQWHNSHTRAPLSLPVKQAVCFWVSGAKLNVKFKKVHKNTCCFYACSRFKVHCSPVLIDFWRNIHLLKRPSKY